ncbi:protein kinase family protein [Luteimonas gilva]|uniref:protein kinase family protein n=1 Tax=Luteimonas gilva TaxID=2572684 RepID=UPI0016745DEA|nr:protein kinase family protein [Luteimonas gilva]
MDTLVGLPLLNGRYSGLELVNVVGNDKRGFFSLVFKAHDELEDRAVALKFFDIDPQKQNRYRILCFEREHQILVLLRGASRCLQVMSDFMVFNLEINLPGQSNPIVIPAPYFATAWLDDDIDDYFNQQEAVDAISKLKLFNDVVLAVESLHSRSIFHRDVKVDNLRQQRSNGRREVVAIDLGTAARCDSPPMLPAYGQPVGLLSYSAPETFCGLAGNRSIAPSTDMYALGCMLFELFHPDDFPSALRFANADFDLRVSALQSRIGAGTHDGERMEAWDIEAPRLLNGLTAIRLSSESSSAPSAIIDIVSDLILEMTRANFRSREKSFARVRKRIWCAIRILENVALARRRSQIAAARRQARNEKARTRALRNASRLPSIAPEVA